MNREDAIKIVRSHYPASKQMLNEALEYLIPELKESEDDRIRRKLLELVHACEEELEITSEDVESFEDWIRRANVMDVKTSNAAGRRDCALSMIEWLGHIPVDESNLIIEAFLDCDWDSLGEYLVKKFPFPSTYPKSSVNSDKVEDHKFTLGQWITDGKSTERIDSIQGCYYKFNDGSMNFINTVDNEYHLWTLKDAKVGDFLSTSDGRAFIFKGFTDTGHPKDPVAFCGITQSDRILSIYNEDHWWTSDDGVRRAEKHEIDELIESLRDSGYKWDPDDKCLVKIVSESK